MGNRFKSFVTDYEVKKKKELVTLGESKKSYNEILVYLNNEIQKSTQIQSFNYKLVCFREDGAYQLNKAVEEVYGASINKGRETPSNGTNPVEMIDVKLSDGSRIKVPFGRIDLPELGKDAYIEIYYDNPSNQLHVDGQCQFRYSSIIDNIINRTEQLLNCDSIYKNQAFELTSAFSPVAINLDNIDKEFMILNKQTEYDLVPLKGRILHPERCREMNVPLKYGCLLEGPYGTGKTLLAFKLAKEAIANNWTFVYLKDPSLLAKTLRLGKILDKNGNGIIIFVEDIDQVTKGERDSALQDILNTLDGGDTKNMNVISLFTTNHIEKIEPTFLRGKRIGSVVSLGFLDAETAKKFLDFSFQNDNYTIEGELDEVCNYIEKSKIAPAFMAEIVEAIKSRMVFSDDNKITAELIKLSVDSYLRQVSLSQVQVYSQSNEEKFAEAFADISIGNRIEKKITNSVANLFVGIGLANESQVSSFRK